MFELTVSLTGVDQYPTRIIHPSVLLKQMQYIAGKDCAQNGLSYQVLRDMGVVFVLTNITLQINASLIEGDIITIQSWEKEIKGPYFIREFSIFRDGIPVASASTNWVLMNFETRTIKRPTLVKDAFLTHDGKSAGVSFKKPKNIIFSSNGDRVVRYSDLDENFHLNNTVYSDIAADFSPVPLDNKRISQLHIDYRRECRLGETILLSGCKTEGGYAIRGEVAGEHSFDAYVLLCDLANQEKASQTSV